MKNDRNNIFKVIFTRKDVKYCFTALLQNVVAALWDRTEDNLEYQIIKTFRNFVKVKQLIILKKENYGTS